ncbi:MAG: hypothetical protein LAT79_15855 [Kiritimatiellae bacterium]|nr:hypothetical protein [Kiritimatiellia bacterium]
MKVYSRSREDWAGFILIIAAVPLLIPTAVKSLLVNTAVHLNMPSSVIIEIMHVWPARWLLIQSVFLLASAILLVCLKRNYGYSAIGAFLLSLLFFVLTPVV